MAKAPMSPDPILFSALQPSRAVVCTLPSPGPFQNAGRAVDTSIYTVVHGPGLELLRAIVGQPLPRTALTQTAVPVPEQPPLPEHGAVTLAPVMAEPPASSCQNLLEYSVFTSRMRQP